MNSETFELEGKVWLYQIGVGWHFFSLPEDLSEEIDDRFNHLKKSFGSIRVTAKIGNTEWKSSIFHDTKHNCYMLPIKAQIREKEKIKTNDRVKLYLTINP